MSDQKLFCLGYGYTAAALARRLRHKGWRIAGTTTREEKAQAMQAEGVEAHLWDGGVLPAGALDDACAILVSTPPSEDGCPAFAAANEAIAERASEIQWIGYLSTNGVYGDHDGAWVDEESALKATSPRSRRRILAESQWSEFADTSDLPFAVFRLPGIYGPGRSALDTVRAGSAKRIYKEGQVFSRMHVEDIAAALEAGIARPRLHNVYNLADDEPAPPQDVIEYACELLNVTPPPLIPIEEADMSAMAKSFYADNKRVSNKRMKEALNVALLHPTYRDGLKAILKGETENT
ncbi:MAG: SDR family oxidoreductase [Pseudomonadota bacterium]